MSDDKKKCETCGGSGQVYQYGAFPPIRIPVTDGEPERALPKQPCPDCAKPAQ